MLDAVDGFAGWDDALVAFVEITPSYHIELLEKPTIYWDFHSLLLGIQMIFSFMLVDDARSLRLCKNQYNIYESRGKYKEQDGDENA